MPSTVNGIGTTYFGTWNRQVQDGICESCHRSVKLVSYETWHCICVLFIPIIPLGKKQILNYCPVCTRHRVMPFREWVKLRDNAIGETMQQVTASPDDPDAAMQMHATLAAFQKENEAAKFAEIIEEKFADVARVQFYLAAWYERSGNNQVGNRLFLKAFDLNPDDIDIRRAAILTFVEQGDVDKAKTLIEPFLPGKEHFQAPISYALATGFQKQGRHEEAVQTLRMLLSAAPSLKTDKAFRKSLSDCEKALGVTERTIPDDPFYKSTGFKWLMGLAAVVAAVLGWNYYIATNRTINIVNGLPATTISVKVDNGNPVEIAPRGRKEITLAEGTHDANVITPAGYPKSMFNFSSSWWERFVRSPVYVVDPTRSAAIKWEETTYAPVGQGARPPERQIDLRLGEPFSAFKHVDYRFTQFPAQIQMKKNSGPLTKSRIGIETDDPESVVQTALSMGRPPSTVLAYLETHLQAQPDQDNLLVYYTTCAMNSDKEASCRQFLAKRLSDRPVRVEWHRWYQILNSNGLSPEEARQAQEKLKQSYDEQLAQDPKNASLLYLRGRLEGRKQAAATFYERALAQEPQHPYALYASSYQQMIVGEFAAALQYLEQAIAAKPNDMEFAAALSRTRFAAGDLVALEKDARESLKPDSLDVGAMDVLLKVLVLTGRMDDADREFERFNTSFRQQTPPAYHSIPEHMRWKLTAIKGDFAALEKQVANFPEPAALRFAFFAKLEQDRLADVPTNVTASNSGYWHLCRELIARRAADADQTAAARKSALDQLDRGVSLDWNVADVLRKSDTITWDEVEGLSPSPSDKAITLVVLAHERTDLRSRLLDLAEKLNFDLEFPHYLLKREIEDLRNK